MKFTLFAVAAFAGIANAQSQCATLAQSIPACALGYIASYAYSSASCGLVDFQCQCSNLGKIAGGVGSQITMQQGCNLADVLPPAQALCSCASSNAGQSISLNQVQSACQASAATIPACALGYLAEGAYSIGQCDLQDFACQCKNFNAIQSAIINTVQGACGSTAFDVISSASNLCNYVSSNGGGSSGGSSAAGSGSAAATTTAAGSSGAAKSSSGAGAGATGAAPSGTAAKTMSVFTGAGSTPAVALSGVFGLVAGLAALL